MLGILALVVGGISFYVVTTYIEKLRLSELHANAQSVAIRTYHFVKSREEVLITIAKSKASEKYYKSYNIPALNAYVSQYGKTLPVIVFESYVAKDVTTFIRGELSIDEFDFISTIGAEKQSPNKLYMSEPYYSDILNTFVIRMGYFYTNYFGDKIGPIFAAIQLGELDPVLKEQTNNLEGNISIVDAKGKVIYSTEHDWIAKSISEISNANDLALLSETPNKATSYNVTTKNNIISIASIQEFNWKVFVSVPMDVFTAPFISLRNSVILVSLVLILMGLLFTNVMGKKITAPIIKLADVIEDISETGDLSRHVLWKGDDELGQLASSFNVMVERLKEYNQKIDDERQFTSGVINSMADSLVIVNKEGNIIKLNAAAGSLLKYDQKEVLDLKITSIVPDFNKVLSGLQAKNEDSIVVDTNFIVPAGIDVPVILTFSIMQGGDIVLVAKDNTERKRMEKIKNEFIATVSHELRTPLTSIMGALGLIEGGVAGTCSAEMKQLLNIANINASRLLLIVNDILDIQKIESGNMEFNYQPLNINQVVTKAVDETILYTEENGVKISISKTDLNEANIYADESRLLQVMNNLLSNAIKFSYKNGVVSISVSRNEGNIRVSVHNHGPEIPKAFHSKVFERFSQADTTDARKNGGAGLGLSITEMIIKQHQGSINFISDTSSGTTFYFDIPKI